MTCMLDSYSVSRAPGRVETAVEKVVRPESEGERSLGARLRGGLDSSMLFLGGGYVGYETGWSWHQGTALYNARIL